MNTQSHSKIEPRIGIERQDEEVIDFYLSGIPHEKSYGIDSLRSALR